MSDYLDNLIAKSLGLAEVVAPRPTSLFEPLRSEAGPLVHEYHSSDHHVAPRRTPAGADHVMDVAAPAQSEDLSSEDAPPQLRGAESDRPSQHPVQSTVQSVDRGASRPEPRLTPNQLVSVEAGQRADRARSATPPPQQPADQRPPDQQMVDSHQSAPVHAPLLIVSHATIPAEPQVPGAPEAEPFAPAQAHGAAVTPLSPSGAKPVELVTPSSPSGAKPVELVTPSSPSGAKPVEPVRPSSPSGAKLVTPVSLRRADQERVSATADRAAIPTPATDAAAPTIKITIGRVDVRAVTPDKESPRPAAPARNQALTLEEYLKRRSGGKI
jgi:hypothetical protein